MIDLESHYGKKETTWILGSAYPEPASVLSILGLPTFPQNVASTVAIGEYAAAAVPQAKTWYFQRGLINAVHGTWRLKVELHYELWFYLVG